MPLLSILIPTKSNLDTICSTFETAQNVAVPDAEIVIQDCGPTDDSEKAIRRIADDRLRYYRSPPGTSMTANWTAGIENCHGDYVCIVGADDGISPRLAEAVRWAAQNNISAIVQSFKAHYNWPYKGFQGTDVPGRLTIAAPYAGNVSLVDAPEAFEAYGRTGADYRETLKLPSLYRSLVSRTLLNRLKEQSIPYVAGTSPDVYSSIVMARVATNWAHMDYPLFLSGWAPGSTTSQEAMGRPERDVKKNPHFREYGKLNWPVFVPELAISPTAVAETTLLALADLNCSRLIEGFNYGALYGRCFMRAPGNWQAILKTLSSRLRFMASGSAPVVATARLAAELMLDCWRLASSNVRYRLSGSAKVFTPINTITQAIETLCATIPKPAFR